MFDVPPGGSRGVRLEWRIPSIVRALPDARPSLANRQTTDLILLKGGFPGRLVCDSNIGLAIASPRLFDVSNHGG
jgi:hypothetical protein